MIAPSRRRALLLRAPWVALALLTVLHLLQLLVLSSSPWQRARAVRSALEPARTALDQVVVPSARPGDPDRLEERRGTLRAWVQDLEREVHGLSRTATPRATPARTGLDLALAAWVGRHGLELVTLERLAPRRLAAGREGLGAGPGSSEPERGWRLEARGTFDSLRRLLGDPEPEPGWPLPWACSIELLEGPQLQGLLRAQLWLYEPETSGSIAVQRTSTVLGEVQR